MSETLVQEINTPVSGASGTLSSPAAPPLIVAYSNILFPSSNFVTTGVFLKPTIFGGAGLPAGSASLTLASDIIGSLASPQTQGAELTATADGGEGDSRPGTAASGNGSAGGTGGDATVTLSGDDLFYANATAGLPTILNAIASAGPGGFGQNSSFLPGTVGGDGGAGGAANATVAGSELIGSGAADLEVFAGGGSGGEGGQGGSTSIVPSGRGGDGGAAIATLTDNRAEAADATLSVTAQGGRAGTGTPNGADGVASLVITGNTIDVGAPPSGYTSNVPDPGMLTLQLTAETDSGATLEALQGGPSGNLQFSGNVLTGGGASTLDLQVSDGGVRVDTAAGTLGIGGSPANTLTGFTRFLLDQNDTFVAGAGTYTVILASDPDTIIVTPGSGGVVLENVQASNFLLNFVAFGTALSTADLAADTSVSDGNTVIALPGAGRIELQGFATPIPAADIEITPACFARGTRIATPDGDVPVEHLRVGDRVLLADGSALSVRWLGSTTIDLRRHRRPELAAPIRIRRDAFGPGAPRRDLLLSPDHAVWIDGVLVPAHLLVNGGSIAPERAGRLVEYWHVELDRHAVLLAEGLPAESYRDGGNRALFTGIAITRATFRSSFAPTVCAAPLVTDAARVEPIWRRLAARSRTLGFVPPLVPVPDDPGPALMIGGRSLTPASATRDSYLFGLPGHSATARLRSRSAAPADTRPWSNDRRRLGLCVGRIVARGAAVTEIALDSLALDGGWHDVEHDGRRSWRWTDGDARLSLPAGAATLEVWLRTGWDRRT